MKKIFITLIAIAVPVAAYAQGQSLGATMDVFVFPAEGQDTAQQSKDEAACYEWAVGNTGTDPFDLAKQEQADEQQAQAEQQAAQQAGTGSGARPVKVLLGELLRVQFVVVARAEPHSNRRRNRLRRRQSSERERLNSSSLISRTRSASAWKPRSTWSSIRICASHRVS
jgi:hypothetical protein